MKLLLLACAFLCGGCISGKTMRSVNTEFRRSVSEVDFKGTVDHSGNDTRGMVNARFKLRDPDRRQNSPGK